MDSYNIIIIVCIILFIFLILLAYTYECTDKFTNWDPIFKKTDPIRNLGLEKYVYDDYKPPELDIPQPASCVCAFDLDHTLTCGDPTHAINMCIEKGCKLAINTARPSKWTADIPLKKYGFVKPHYDERDHYFNINSYKQTAKQVGQTKANYLQLLKDKYKVPDKRCVILFDDANYNLKAAEERGFSTIAASERGHCGVHPNKSTELHAVLRNC